ncbi:LacI family DNA-binding transcriptional regulator [Aeromonas jandaei]|uniref:substrate-binding domain-containing protein n=1 Tax=Aeromonas jandaei TaxID=650 RepID=UPI001931A843|nr:substrate-binding domain-containing protein [Aeromonas jandaei]MBM0492845.1 LacI family DNA-binding transcriptional regulator [Aeromonas jandaei]MBM0570590.1 LacI family DNA-binding transcriptional regulator [Aeromonas jandaei]
MSPTRKRRPTLQDIADLTGVTKMTVSRYLRDPQTVAEGTRERIAAAVEELGYIPNRAPDILSNATSRAIGILIPSLSNQVFSALIHGIEAVTRPAGYQTLLAHYGYSPEREEEQIASLLSYNVDGLILSDSRHTERTRKMIATAGIPVVETMDLPPDPIDMVVGMDHQAAARAMVSEMLRRGRRKVVYLGARLDVRTQLRMEGYYQAMADFGLTGQHLLTEQSSTFTLGGELLEQALVRYPDLDGLFCTNDDLAVGALLQCQSRWIPVPQQIAIAGSNALDIGHAMTPKLASIVTPREEIGREAAAMLLARLGGKPPAESRKDMGFTLYEGESLG